MTQTHIVLADDEPDIRALIAEILEEEGYTVEAFGDGLNALAAIRRHAPALAILDVAMPAMTGDEALRQLRAEQLSIPVIIMTAGRSPWRLLGEGATQVLTKPFELHALLDTVAQTLRPHAGLAAKALGARGHL